MKKIRFAFGSAILAGTTVVLASCGGSAAPAAGSSSTPAAGTSSAPAQSSSSAPAQSSSSSQAAASSSSAASQEVGNINICVASTPDHLDPALNSAVDGATYAVHLFSGLVRYVPVNGKLELAADLAKSLPAPTATEDGMTKYTFELRDNITFSDGTPIKASDFVKSWNRAAGTTNGSVIGLDADYEYMFDIIDGYGTALTAENKYSFLNVTADDEAKTLEVVLPVDVPYFYELCAFPAYAVLKDADQLDNDGLWAKQAGAVTSGAYAITQYTSGVQLKMTKRADYWDSANVKTNSITALFSDDDSAVFGQYEAGELQFTENLPISMMAQLKERPDYHVLGQLGTYYVSYNINGALTSGLTQKQAEDLRNGLNLLINRKYIVEQVTKAGQTPSTGFVGAGLTDPLGGEFVDHNGVNGDGAGYFGDAENYQANVAAGIELIKAAGFTYDEGTRKFTNVPTINYILNTSSGHQKVAEALQALFKNFGINMNVSDSEWAQFLNTRKDGDFDVARNGWLADYNDPISFLDMWTTTSGNNDCQFGRGAAAAYTYSIDLTGIGTYGELSGTWAETYDVIIAAVKANSDANIRYALMHKAEDLLMSTGCIGSIYNYTNTYLQSLSLTNIYASPLGYKYFTWATAA